MLGIGLDGSMLDSNRVIAKDVKSCTNCCYVINSMSRGNILAQNIHNPLPYTVKTFRQRSCNPRVGCLPCSMARIYDIRDGYLDKRKVRSMVLCCGEDVYRAQVPQHPIDSYRYISCKHRR